MKYIYHYHATIQRVTNVIIHLDGILGGTKIEDKDDYKSLKETIAKYYDCGYNAKNICIESLSLLHTE